DEGQRFVKPAHGQRTSLRPIGSRRTQLRGAPQGTRPLLPILVTPNKPRARSCDPNSRGCRRATTVAGRQRACTLTPSGPRCVVVAHEACTVVWHHVREHLQACRTTECSHVLGVFNDRP